MTMTRLGLTILMAAVAWGAAYLLRGVLLPPAYWWYLGFAIFIAFSFTRSVITGDWFGPAGRWWRDSHKRT